MKTYFGYIRLPITSQGEESVSLLEQKCAILEYASRGGITIPDYLFTFHVPYFCILQVNSWVIANERPPY